MRRALLWMAIGALLIGTMAACGTADEPDVGNGELPPVRVAIRADIQDFDPVHLQDAPTSGVSYSIYQHLVFRAHDGTLEPGLAVSWEGSEDAQTWTFNLRQGVTFHDGSPFNAEVVKFHFERVLDPETGSHAMDSFATNIKEINILGDYEMEFVLHGPNAAFIDQVIITNAAYIPSMKAVQELGEAISQNPVGTGPFKFERWVPDTEVVLTRYEDHWGGMAKSETLIFRPIPEVGTQLAELRTGGVHFIPTVPPEQIQTLDADPEIVVLKEPDFNIRALHINMNIPLFQDVRVRQALNHAVDVETIVREFLAGVAEKAVGPFAIESWAHDPNVPEILYDPDRAEELLNDAGWVRDADGMFRKDGKTLAFTLSTPVGRYTKDKEVCEAIHYQLRQFGIDVAFEQLEFATLVDKLRARDYDLGYIGFMTRSGEPAAMPDHLFTTTGWANWSDYSNPEVDALMAQGRTTADIEARKVFYHQAQALISLDAPIIPIMNENLLVAHRAEVKGYEFSASRTQDYHGVWIDN